jgi:putative membrane-bound dehydrogenase-like protein
LVSQPEGLGQAKRSQPFRLRGDRGRTQGVALGLELPALRAEDTALQEPDAPPPGFHHVKLNGHTFTLPDGFTIELAAAPPLADRPIVAALDEKGRLYVCDSSGSNEKVTEQVVKKPHRIVRLEDTDGDGKYDKSVVYVSNVMFPEGAMWLAGSLYVGAPPHIWKFTDTNDDGRADKEEIWFDGKTLTGCANDLHGPYLGPDGWVYWCKGAFAQQTYTLPNGKPFTTKASHIFRARPDGSNMEPVMTGGMDNPVDVVFTPGGERIFSTTFFQHPGNGRRDGLIHAVYGAVYGKDHAPVYDHPWTHPTLMPPMTHLGPAAPCGLHRYESDQFGKEYANNVYCCQFNMRKVSRHVLKPSGSTFVTRDSDFVVSDNRDFHPTDVIEDADGSLLILDTGGWYKLCCPTSQLVKPDVTGAVYRVKKVGAHKTRTKPAAQPLPRLYTVALNRDRAGLGEAVAGLRDANRHTRRLAAEAIGRIGDPSAIPALLEALADESNDRVLDHSLTFALIEIGDRDATAKGLAHKMARVRRACLAGLDQMPNGNPDPKSVIAELSSYDVDLRETAWWVAGRHPEWGEHLVGYFREQLKQTDGLPPAARDDLTERLAKFAKNEAIQKALADVVQTGARDGKVIAVRAMARAGLKEPPAEWFDALAAAIGKGGPDLTEFLRAARVLPPPKTFPVKLTEALFAVAENEKQSPELRLAACAALHPAIARLDAHTYTLALDSLSPDQPGTARSAAADALTRANLTPPQLIGLAVNLKTFGPLDVAKLLPAYEKSKDEKVGLMLVRELADPKLRGVIRIEQVKPILDKYPPPVRAEAEKLYALLAEARKDESAKLERLLKEMPAGDIRRGQLIFNGNKAQCAACHKIGYVGGLVGPDLTRIGGIRTERDLLESIVFPSASFVRSYEPVRVRTLDGRTLGGILKKDAPDEIILTIAADKEERVARADVEDISPGSVSVMPAGLDQQLTPQELADLVAFLKACK